MALSRSAARSMTSSPPVYVHSSPPSPEGHAGPRRSRTMIDHIPYGWIIFPPAKPLPNRGLVGVIIVAPALAHHVQRQQPIVPGLIRDDVPPPTDEARERVDAERHMHTVTVLQ